MSEENANPTQPKDEVDLDSPSFQQWLKDNQPLLLLGLFVVYTSDVLSQAQTFVGGCF